MVRRLSWLESQVRQQEARPAEPQELRAETSGGVLHGAVGYSHAGGIDRPLVITKAGRSPVIPHQNWRGQFVLGTYPGGVRSDCAPGQTTGCEPIAWPGHRTTAWHRESKAPDIRTWYGGLVDGMRDASGQMYMRSRYYDPATGQFTQPDPIGLAGGLNSYGFAAGDPVTYSDPYGLSAEAACPWCIGAVVGAAAGGGGKALHNYLNDRPLGEGVAKYALGGAVVGGTLGLGAGALGARGLQMAATAAPAAAAVTANAPRLTIQFGRVANQVSHTFRHVRDAGLDPGEVRSAVLQHLPTVVDQMQPGKTLNQVITVAGTRLQYSAHQIAEGVINVGRIHPVP